MWHESALHNTKAACPSHGSTVILKYRFYWTKGEFLAIATAGHVTVYLRFKVLSITIDSAKSHWVLRFSKLFQFKKVPHKKSTKSSVTFTFSRPLHFLDGQPNHKNSALKAKIIIHLLYMVIRLYLYSTFLVFQLLKALLQHKSAFTHSHTNSHTNHWEGSISYQDT